MQLDNLLAKPPQPNITQSLDFLQEMFTNDVWHLVAVHLRGTVETKSFGLDKRGEVRKWLNAKQGEANCYFYINRLKFGATSLMASKSDIKFAMFCHVAIGSCDPVVLARLQAFRPAPSLILQNGSGYQAIWRLGTMTKNFDRVERINRALENRLGGDNGYHVNAMMPLPGTITLPSSAKLPADRISSLVEVVNDYRPIRELKSSPTFKLDDFPETHSPNLKPINFPANETIVPLGLDALPDKLPDDLAKLIQHGDDPDHPIGSKDARFRDSNEVVWKVATDLALLNNDPSIIAGLMLNRELEISKTILSKRCPQNFTIRLIQSAFENMSTGWHDVYKDGSPKQSMQNALSALTRLGVDFEYDSFNNRKGFRIDRSISRTELSEDGCANLRKLIVDRLGFDPGKGHTFDAANILCLENSFHPVLDYIDAIEWDGETGIDRMLTDYFGADATPYTLAVSKHLMVSAIRRLRQPGTRLDNLIVLEAEYGSAPSAALQILAGETNHSNQSVLALDPRAQVEAVEGVWIYELCRLEGLTRVEASKINTFMMRQENLIRPTGPKAMPHRARQCSFVATTVLGSTLNPALATCPLLPVKTGQIDLDGLEHDRDQLWAEAAHLESQVDELIFPEKLRPDEQKNHTGSDPWLEVLGKVEGHRKGDYNRISTQELAEVHLGIKGGHLHAYHPKRLGNLMRGLGWVGPKKFKLASGKTTRGYERHVDYPNQSEWLARK
jgi:Virulence-associated protein E-like domain